MSPREGKLAAALETPEASPTAVSGTASDPALPAVASTVPSELSWDDLSPQQKAKRREEFRKKLEEWHDGRKALLHILRQNPQINTLLHAWPDANDAELLESFAQVVNPRDFLRHNGYAPEDVATAAELVAPALAPPPCRMAAGVQATTESLKSGEEITPHEWDVSVGGCGVGCLVLAALLLLTIAIIFAAGNATWEGAECNIARFTDDNCTATAMCSFDVDVHSDSGQRWMMVGWELPREVDYYTQQVVVVGDAFRCCDHYGKECCDMLDEKFYSFCDDWPNRLGPGGEICPGGRWRCRYRLDSTATEIQTLEHYDTPPILALSLSAGGAALLAIGLGILLRLRLRPKRVADADTATAQDGDAADTEVSVGMARSKSNFTTADGDGGHAPSKRLGGAKSFITANGEPLPPGAGSPTAYPVSAGTMGMRRKSRLSEDLQDLYDSEDVGSVDEMPADVVNVHEMPPAEAALQLLRPIITPPPPRPKAPKARAIRGAVVPVDDPSLDKEWDAKVQALRLLEDECMLPSNLGAKAPEGGERLRGAAWAASPRDSAAQSEAAPTARRARGARSGAASQSPSPRTGRAAAPAAAAVASHLKVVDL